MHRSTARSALACLVVAVLAPMESLECQSLSDLEEASYKGDGAELSYRIGGSGPPLLLLHGMTGVSQAWDEFLPPLMREFRVIVPDLRGHGKSTNESGTFTFPEVTADLFGLLNSLDIDSLTAIGYSIGGMTLLHMAAMEPTRFAGMILVAGGHRVTDQRRLQLRSAPDFEALTDAERERYLEAHPGGVEQVRSLLAHRRDLADNFVNISEEHLARIDLPVLLLWGDEDESSFHMPIPVELREALPQAELWLVPGQRHSILWPEWGGSSRVAALFPIVAASFLGDAWEGENPSP